MLEMFTFIFLSVKIQHVRTVPHFFISIVFLPVLGVSEDAKHGSNIIQVFVSVIKTAIDMFLK